MCKDCKCDKADRNGYTKFDRLSLMITTPLLSISLIGLVLSAILNSAVAELVFAIIGILSLIVTEVFVFLRSQKRRQEIVKLHDEIDELKERLDNKK